MVIKPDKLALRHVGQLFEADVTFGDLTVFVGPQATGKSIFLQFLKLVVDAPAILNEFRRFNIDWQGRLEHFLELYFGEGMSGIWSDQSTIAADELRVDLKSLLKPGRKKKDEKLFFIPAQRVMSVRDGLTRPFTDYRSGDPFVLREFSEQLHRMMQSEFGQRRELFPQTKRLKSELRELIEEHIFGGFKLQADSESFQRRITLNKNHNHAGKGKNLPYLVWSAGQREFVPLLLGFYWLMPPARISRRNTLEWVVIEELEMGLHPDAITAVLALVLELLHRGYRVCLSTHSPHVLDVVWALSLIQRNQGDVQDALDLFGLRRSTVTLPLARTALMLQARAYAFGRDGRVRDISTLDPASEDIWEAGWGGLTGFSAKVGDIVARVVSQTAHQEAMP